MKAIVSGLLLAAVLAVTAAFVLEDNVQRSTTDRFQTEAVRIGPGSHR